MTLSINTIKGAKGSRQKRKRIGRGNASGTGTYSGRGLKGQKARAGVSNLKRLGMKQVLLRTPKVRGFKSDKQKNQVINLRELNHNFQDGAKIDPKALLAKKMINSAAAPVKILGQGDLKVSKLSVHGIKVSASAKKKIEEKGGKVV